MLQFVIDRTKGSLPVIDIAVIGAGPIGLTCAIEARKRGLKAVVFEKGCLTNSLYNFPTNMTFFSTPDLIEIGSIPFICRDMKPTRSEALEYYRRVVDYFQLDVRLYEPIERVDGSEGAFELRTPKGTYSAKYVVASVGFFDLPRFMNVPGEDLDKVIHYYPRTPPLHRSESPYRWQRQLGGHRRARMSPSRRPRVDGGSHRWIPRRRQILVAARY